MGNGAQQRAPTTFNPDAATRTARHRGRPAASIPRLLADGQELVSPEAGQRYRVELGMIVRGDAGARLRSADVRDLACGDHLKEIIHRCIGERRKRYETAGEMIDALRNPPATLRAGVLRSLKGVHLAFTGFLRRPRSEAARAAARAGAIVHGGPSSKTTVIVRGRPNKLQAAGRDGGLKLMEIKRLREKGQRITLLNEAQFWRLAAEAATGRSR